MRVSKSQLMLISLHAARRVGHRSSDDLLAQHGGAAPPFSRLRATAPLKGSPKVEVNGEIAALVNSE